MFTTRRGTADPGGISKGAGPAFAAPLSAVGLSAILFLLSGAGRADAQDPAPAAGPETESPKAEAVSPVPTGSGAVRPVAPPRRFARGGLLDLEDAVARAELIIAVRLVDMTESKIVHGGKTEVVTQQFKL